jgi:hypothetical protein
MYFLRHFIKKGMNVVYESVDNNCVWVFSPNGCHSYEGIASTRNCPELSNRETYFIFDAKAGDNCREPIRCPAFLLLFSSPNIASYKQRARNNVPKVGFTSPSKEELMILGAISKFNVENLFSYIDGSHESVTRSDNPSVLFKTSASEDKFETLNMAYSCDNIQWRFASNHKLKLVCDKYEGASDSYIEKYFIKYGGIKELAGLSGFLLELHAPKKIAAGGFNEIRPLRKNNVTECEPSLKLQLPQLDVKKVSYSKNEIEKMLNECKDPKILYNICGNFPAIDLYNPPSNFFQLTVRRDGHTINLNSICTICDSVSKIYGNKTDVNLYFVVPDNFNNWKNMQSFTYKEGSCVYDKLIKETQNKLVNFNQFVFKYITNSIIYNLLKSKN